MFQSWLLNRAFLLKTYPSSYFCKCTLLIDIHPTCEIQIWSIYFLLNLLEGNFVFQSWLINKAFLWQTSPSKFSAVEKVNHLCFDTENRCTIEVHISGKTTISIINASGKSLKKVSSKWNKGIYVRKVHSKCLVTMILNSLWSNEKLQGTYFSSHKHYTNHYWQFFLFLGQDFKSNRGKDMRHPLFCTGLFDETLFISVCLLSLFLSAI